MKFEQLNRGVELAAKIKEVKMHLEALKESENTINISLYYSSTYHFIGLLSKDAINLIKMMMVSNLEANLAELQAEFKSL